MLMSSQSEQIFDVSPHPPSVLAPASARAPAGTFYHAPHTQTQSHFHHFLTPFPSLVRSPRLVFNSSPISGVSQIPAEPNIAIGLHEATWLRHCPPSTSSSCSFPWLPRSSAPWPINNKRQAIPPPPLFAPPSPRRTRRPQSSLQATFKCSSWLIMWTFPSRPP